MHEEVLSQPQKQLLPLIQKFSPQFGLVGGTAIALHFGHRRSIDFDLVTLQSINHQQVTETIRESFAITSTVVDEPNELSVIVDSVKLTFFHYPFPILFKEQFSEGIFLPDLLTLAAMKAYALGRRAKWKDYVDLYFVFKEHSLEEVTNLAHEIFQGEFNERFFREQLSYFDDVDYSEAVDYLEGFEVDDETVKDALRQTSLQEE